MLGEVEILPSMWASEMSHVAAFEKEWARWQPEEEPGAKALVRRLSAIDCRWPLPSGRHSKQEPHLQRKKGRVRSGGTGRQNGCAMAEKNDRKRIDGHSGSFGMTFGTATLDSSHTPLV